MAYDTDISKVMDRFNSWAREAVIGEDSFRDVDSLMQHHRDDRGRQFEECINALKRDKDIQSAFDSACDKALDLNDRLRSQVEAKVSYAGGYGFTQAGFSSFFTGEKYAWETCKGGRVGLIAEAIGDIEVSNVEIFKKLEEDLKKCREEAAVVDELSRAQFKQWQTSVAGFAADIVANLAALPVYAIPGISKTLGPKSKDLVKTLLGGDAAMRELANKKAAAKAIMLTNDNLVINAQAQIGDSAVEDIRRRVEDIAKSWKDTTRNDFNADWEYFGRACTDVINEKASRARDKAQKLYNDMHPMYIEALKNSFTSILSDPSSIASFNGQLDDEVSKMFDELARQSDQAALLRDSDPKRNAIADMDTIKAELTEALTKLKRTLDENEQLMKK